jgi:hypothetical protein
VLLKRPTWSPHGIEFDGSIKVSPALAREILHITRSINRLFWGERERVFLEKGFSWPLRRFFYDRNRTHRPFLIDLEVEVRSHAIASFLPF